MKYTVVILVLLIAVSGCVSDSSRDVVRESIEYASEVSRYGDDVYIYEVELSMQQASDLSDAVPEIVPVQSKLVFISNKKIINRGYVFQVSGDEIISKLDLDYYAARSSDMYVETYSFDASACSGASMSLVSSSYENGVLKLDVKNTGDVGFDMLTLTVVDGGEYLKNDYLAGIGANETYSIMHEGTDITEYQVYPESCPMVRLRGFV